MKTEAFTRSLSLSVLVTTFVFGFTLSGSEALAQTSTTTTTVSTIPLCEITRALTIGSMGEDVRCLQRYLNYAGFRVAMSGPGSPGNESMYFGPLTRLAVINWQNQNASSVLTPYGLTSGTGYWGNLSFNRYVFIVRTTLGVL